MANQDRVNFVWAETALTTIPPIPVSEVAYRDTAQTPEQMEVGQQYDTIYNSARYNQLLFLLTSVAKTLCENGIMPFLAGQEYSQYARCIFTDGKLYTASRAILANEQPYPTPGDDSGVWTTKETDENFVPDSRRVIAGTGLTGGGVLSQDVTLAARPYQGATEAQPGVSGIVPGAPIGAQNKVFSGRGDYIPTAQIGDISVNEDLNTYNTIGFYTCTSNFIAGTIQNSPTNIAFSLLVEKAAGPVQTLKEYSTNGTARIFWRTQDEFSGAWGAWSQLPNSILKNTQVVVTTRGTPAYAPSGGTWICRGVSVRFDVQATASELALFMLDNVSSVIVPGGTKIRDTQASTGVIYWCDQIEP